MKRSIVEVNMPQHYRDSSLSSLDSVFSTFSDLIGGGGQNESIASDYHRQPLQHHFQFHTTIDSNHQQSCPSEGDAGSSNYITMQEEYDSSTKQPTPGRPKMVRVVAKTSPEISALCRKSYPSPPIPPLSPLPSQVQSEQNENTSQQDSSRYMQIVGNPRNIENNNDSYNLSSDSSNFSMSSSSMESFTYNPVNHTSSISTGTTWEETQAQRERIRKKEAWIKRSTSGGNTLRTAASTTGGTTSASITTMTTNGTARRPDYVSVRGPFSNDETRVLNYSGSDLELEAVTASLNTIQLYHPEPRVRRDSFSSYCSAPTGGLHSSCVSLTGRHSLHRRLSYDQLPTPEMIMYESFPLEERTTASVQQSHHPSQPPPPPPPLSPMPVRPTLSYELSPGTGSCPGIPHDRKQGHHRRNTTHIIMPPLKPVIS